MADTLNLTKAYLDTADGKFLTGSEFSIGTATTVKMGSPSRSMASGVHRVEFIDNVLSFTTAGGDWSIGDVKTAHTGSNDGTEDDKPVGSWTETTLTNLKFTGTTAATLAVGTGIKDVKMGGGADVVSLDAEASVDLAAGNDAIKLDANSGKSLVSLGAGDDTVIGAGGKASISLGAGKDVVSLSSGEAAVVDYNYMDDVIYDEKVGAGSGGASLTADGVFKGSASLTLASDTDVFVVKAVKDQDAATELTYFATAKTGAGAVSVDLSAATATDTLQVDLQEASSADVKLGKAAEANVILKDGNNAVDAITFAGTKASVENFALTGDSLDKLSIEKVSLGNLTLTGDDTSLGVNDSVVLKSGVDLTTETGILDLNDKKIAFDVTTPGAALDDKVADQFYGQSGKTSLSISKNHFLTQDKDNYKTIDIINLSAEGAAVQGIQIEGSAAKDIIDVSNSTAGAMVNGGAGDDSIKLGGTASDVLLLGKGAGTDDVSGFTYGKGDAADVLYLWDTAALADIKLAQSALNTIKATAGDGSANVTLQAGTDEKSDILKVRLADGSDHKVITALGLGDDTNVIALDAADQSSADFFVFADAGSTIKLTGEEGASTYIDTRATAAYTGKLGAIDGTANKGNMDIAGVGLVTLGSGTNNVFGAGVNSSVDLQDAAGTDSIWFQADEKNVTVKNFDAENDNVWLLDAADLNSVVSKYDFNINASQVEIKAKGEGATGVLNIDGAKLTDSKINLRAADGTTVYKAIVKDQSVDFASDVNIYGGTINGMNVGADISGTEIRIGLGTEASSIMATAYGAPYTQTDTLVNFDGSKSVATMVVRGSSKGASNIAGGTTANVLYGGSKDADTLVGGGVDAIDTFWWGTADGNDQITQIDKGDIVYLWDVASADLGNVAVTATDADSKLTIGGSALTMIDNGALFNGGVTVVTSDFKNYVYDQATSSLVEKA